MNCEFQLIYRREKKLPKTNVHQFESQVSLLTLNHFLRHKSRIIESNLKNRSSFLILLQLTLANFEEKKSEFYGCTVGRP